MVTAVSSEPDTVASPRPKFGNLPALPEVTYRILALARDPSSTSAELQRLICSDVALTTRILKVVNSAYYGLSRQIGTVERAVIVLGRNAVRNIAIASSMIKVFSPGLRAGETGIDPKRLWLHSTATATAGRILSERLKIGDSNELFLAGLTHDIGLMAEMHWAPQKLVRCVRDVQLDRDGVPQSHLTDAEQVWFGMDHQALGQEVCEFWNFPDMIAAVAGSHHRPLTAGEEYRDVVLLIHVADLMAAGLPEGFRTDLVSLDIDDCILETLRLRRSELPGIAKQLQQELAEVSELLE